jgi:hypothetical protein
MVWIAERNPHAPARLKALDLRGQIKTLKGHFDSTYSQVGELLATWASFLVPTKVTESIQFKKRAQQLNLQEQPEFPFEAILAGWARQITAEREKEDQVQQPL